MARDAIAKFLSEYLPANPEVKASLDRLAGEELVQAAVQAGAKADCAFSEDEFRDLMWAVAARKTGRGELSEEQLEAVAGGKAGPTRQPYMTLTLDDVMVSSWS